KYCPAVSTIQLGGGSIERCERTNKWANGWRRIGLCGTSVHGDIGDAGIAAKIDGQRATSWVVQPGIAQWRHCIWDLYRAAECPLRIPGGRPCFGKWDAVAV